MVQRIAMAPQGAGIFTFCDGLLASDGLEMSPGELVSH